LILLAVAMFKSLFDNAIKAFSPSIISNLYDSVTPKLATFMNIAILIVGVMGTVSAYVISRRFKNEAVVIAVCFCIAIPFFAFSLLAGRVNYWLIVIALALVEMLLGVCTLYTTSFIASRFNTIGRGATVAGIINCVACLGIVVANLIFPAIADAIGWNSVLITWAILMLIATALAIAFVPKWTKFLKSR
jgi:predicted MFS family arabinose efflux permease